MGNAYGITIRDTTEDGKFLSFDLRDILAVLGDKVLTSYWHCSDVECLGEGAAAMHVLSDEGGIVTGRELVRIASEVYQTIDGKFEAFETGAETPWLVIDVVDSSWFDVLSCDVATIDRLRTHFRQIAEYPSEDLRYYLDCQ